MSQQFRSLGVSEAICDALATRGIDAPFQIQSLVIPEALRGGDVLAKSPTGSGKTLAFAIPIVQRVDPADLRPAALVLVPTRELAAQVTEEFEYVSAGRLRIASVYGGVPLKPQADVAKKAHVLVATPGRLQDLVDRRLISIAEVRVLILDEADRMLDMGFKPQVDKIVRLLPEDRQTMFFSRHARRRGRRAGAPLHAHAGPLRGRAAARDRGRARSTTASSRSRPTRR